MANITAWVKKVWKDRKTEYPTRRTLTKTNGSQEIVTVARNEGNVSQEGDAFSAANMNDLEERIDAGFTELTGKLSNGTSGDCIGYYASQTFSKNDMTNTTAGNIKVVNRNGIVTIYIQNLQCTTNVPLLNINGYVGDSYYIYDKAGTGLYIDNSMLYSTRQNIDYLVFSFCL